MKRMTFHRTIQASAILVAFCSSGCLTTRPGTLEVLDPGRAYGKSLAVANDLHRDNNAIEKRLAADLLGALAKRGLKVEQDPAKADLIVLTTLGRMREAAPAASAVTDVATVTGSGTLLNPAAMLTSPALSSRRAVPSALPASGGSRQRAGLLLTAVSSKDFEKYGLGRDTLPPVWRIYVSQDVVSTSWRSAVLPLVDAAAAAAQPLAGAPASP